MAKQSGENFITGTFDNLCFYKMEGKYYVRMKSSLTRKRVIKSAAFTRTMKSARELAAASVLASQVYRTIAKNKRKCCWYRKMTGMAKVLLRNGECKENIMKQLHKFVESVLPVANFGKYITRGRLHINLFTAVPYVKVEQKVYWLQINRRKSQSSLKCRSS